MHITRCSNNHYYDLDKYDRCPFCTSIHSLANEEQTIAYDVKAYYQESKEEQLTLSYGEGVSDDGKTIGTSLLHQKVNPVSGWIVCLSGAIRGKFYPIYSGKNFIGSSRKMDVSIVNGEGIEPEKHCCIVYDPKGIHFFIVATNGNVQVNGKPVMGSAPIDDDDLIRIGQTDFRFVQYCNEERNWNE